MAAEAQTGERASGDSREHGVRCQLNYKSSGNVHSLVCAYDPKHKYQLPLATREAVLLTLMRMRNLWGDALRDAEAIERERR